MDISGGFSFLEVLSLIGLIQCVYLSVHIAFRFGRIGGAILPFSYFLLLGLAFLADFGSGRISSAYYPYFQWGAWFSGPPLSVLLVMQLKNQAQRRNLRDFAVLLFLPLGAMVSLLASSGAEDGCTFLRPCRFLFEMLDVTGAMAGAVSLLLIFGRRGVSGEAGQKSERVRYWLIFCIIVLNALFLAVVLAGLAGRLGQSDILLIRNILGLGFVYLVSTGVLRVLPLNLQEKGKSASVQAEDLSPEETALAHRIENLFNLEKIYQEPAYSRADMARECAVPESMVSRVVNAYFGKSFPQLLNERRVEDAKRLLLETDAPMQVICGQAGFNSLPSFNRVFRELTGETPGQFRRKGQCGG